MPIEVRIHARSVPAIHLRQHIDEDCIRRLPRIREWQDPERVWCEVVLREVASWREVIVASPEVEHHRAEGEAIAREQAEARGLRANGIEADQTDQVGSV